MGVQKKESNPAVNIHDVPTVLGQESSFEGKLELPYEGQNTRAFDDAVFSAALNEPTKVQSQWGFHLVLVTERGGGERAVIAPDAQETFSAETAQLEPRDDAGRSL